MKKKSVRGSIWYSTFKSPKGWSLAVIVGSPDNKPQVLGVYVSEQNAAFAALRHYARSARKAAFARGRARVRVSARRAVAAAYATARAQQIREIREIGELLTQMRAMG